MAIAETERLILTQWKNNQKNTLVHIYVSGNTRLGKKRQQGMVELQLQGN